ncbi:MAG: hypothetical protein EXX96DRAFT_536686 [Benjaminiella poitrasii]|nr:MAG: hypothetical protein EXX96DRAFT_536686 [Benjaminiella poitrasii]
MSKFSYDDLPWEVASQLQCLDLELEEGDITQKGYEKKRNQLLAPFKELIEEKSRSINPPLLDRSTSQSINSETQGTNSEQENSCSTDAMLDLGPEPSAADVTDFLDFLPSPTHSPVDHENKGATFMEENHQSIIQNRHDNEIIAEPNNRHALPNPPSHLLPSRIKTNSINYEPMNNLQQSSLPPRPFAPLNNYRPVQNYMSRPSFDPRMAPRPVYRNAFPPGRPPMRPPPPPLPSSSSQLNPIYRPQQSQSGYSYRPAPPPSSSSVASHSSPSTPTHITPPFAQQQHIRSPSIDSKHDFGPIGMTYNQNMRQNLELATEPESIGDWGIAY